MRKWTPSGAEGSAMDCSDVIVLQRLLDGDLDEVQAELVSHHVEDCADCRAVTKNLAAARSFVQDHLGVEDEGEEDAASTALDRIARALPAQTARAGASGWWRRAWLAAAVLASLVVLFPMPFTSKAGASPTKILETAATRERMWKYQPNKVLQWEVNTISRGIKDIADGQWRTVFWQRNGATTFTQNSRQFDPQGRTQHAYWQRPDGSTISYRPKSHQVEISPSTTAAQQALPTLDPELRQALQSLLARRKTMRSLDFNSHRDADWLHRPSSEGTATLRRSSVVGWGEVNHITVVNGQSRRNPSIVRAVHEYDIESSTFRLLRLKSTISYADGTVGVHDSRWVLFREVSATEFAAQTHQDLLESGMPLVQLTPLDVARRQLQEMNHPRTATN